MKPTKKIHIVLTVLSIAGALGIVMSNAMKRARAASTITVTSSADSGIGTLREAVSTAVAGDTIRFAPSTFPAVVLTSGQITIDKDLTIEGPGADVLTVRRDSNAGAFRIFLITSGNTATVSGLTISGGSVTGNAFPNDSGGGIMNEGTLTITDSTLSDNAAATAGGGVYNVNQTLTVRNCTVSGNSAGSAGGGIYNFRDTVTVSNSTFSGNSAGSGGGGIFNLLTLTVGNSTFSGNSAGIGGGGGIYNFAGGTETLNLDSSIVANNSSAVGADIRGSVSSGDYNLIEVTFGIQGGLPGTHNKTGIDPMLGPLAFNGGPTQTHALTCGSPAIDAGNTTEPLLTDQRGRGFPRTFDDPGVPNEPGGDGTDLGSFEQVCAQTPFFTDCPANIAAANDPGQCSATVSFTVSAAGDPTPTVECRIGGSVITSPHIFPPGATTVVCTATNIAGLATCQFNVAVSDNQRPSVACLADQSVSNTPGLCGAVVNYASPLASDNCPGASVSCSPASGSLFTVGVTTVTCTATDASNNKASCSFAVRVNDTQAPTITCPSDVIGVAPAQCPPATSTPVNFAAPTATDNCPGVTTVCSPASGSAFPVGTTSVTCIATDAANNKATCAFAVRVFNGCLQDDSNPANQVLFNTQTGEYRFCRQGIVATGSRNWSVRGCIATIEDNTPDRRVLIRVDFSANSGSASLQMPPGSLKCTIMDRNLMNNSCACNGNP